MWFSFVFCTVPCEQFQLQRKLLACSTIIRIFNSKDKGLVAHNSQVGSPLFHRIWKSMVATITFTAHYYVLLHSQIRENGDDKPSQSQSIIPARNGRWQRSPEGGPMTWTVSPISIKGMTQKVQQARGSSSQTGWSNPNIWACQYHLQ